MLILVVSFNSDDSKVLSDGITTRNRSWQGFLHNYSTIYTYIHTYILPNTYMVIATYIYPCNSPSTTN